MTGIKYSIIVPAYNVETYLARCLDSLVRQGDVIYEIIVVDDGSTDKTLEIARKYSKKYKMIKVFHQKNVGLARTRRNGISKASGKYCLTVDSDDWLDDNALTLIDEIITKYGGVDVLKFKFIYDPSGRVAKDYKNDGKVLNKDEVEEVRKGLLLANTYNNLCNQVFRRDLYLKAYRDEFDGINYGEDLIVNLNLLGRSEKIFLFNKALYHYYDNTGSLTHTVSVGTIKKCLSDGYSVYKERVGLLNDYDVPDVDSSVLKRILLMSVCGRLKQYMANGGSIVPELQEALDEIGISKEISGVDISRMPLLDSFICRSVINRKLNKIALLRPIFMAKGRARKLYYFVLKKKNGSRKSTNG